MSLREVYSIGRAKRGCAWRAPFSCKGPHLLAVSRQEMPAQTAGHGTLQVIPQSFSFLLFTVYSPLPFPLRRCGEPPVELSTINKYWPWPSFHRLKAKAWGSLKGPIFRIKSPPGYAASWGEVRSYALYTSSNSSDSSVG